MLGIRWVGNKENLETGRDGSQKVQWHSKKYPYFLIADTTTLWYCYVKVLSSGKNARAVLRYNAVHSEYLCITLSYLLFHQFQLVGVPTNWILMDFCPGYVKLFTGNAIHWKRRRCRFIPSITNEIIFHLSFTGLDCNHLMIYRVL